MGIHAKDVKEGAMAAGMPSNRVIISKTHDELTTKIIQEIKSKDMVFLKGSRMMQFEKVSERSSKTFRTAGLRILRGEPVYSIDQGAGVK